MDQNSVTVDYGSDEIPRVPHKKKARTGVMPSHNQQGNNNYKHKVSQGYCLMYNKYVIHDRTYKLHSSENFSGRSSNQEYTKYGLGGNLGNRVKSVKPFQNSKNKWKS